MKTSNKSVWRFLFKLHRYTGLCAAIFIVILATTGIALNHTDDLKLDSNYVKSATLLDWYGIKPPETTIAFETKNHWFIQSGEQLYFDTKKILKNSNPLIGVVNAESFFLLGFTNALILLSPQGEVIEKIEKPLKRIGVDAEQTIFIISKNQVLSSQDQLLSWQQADSRLPVWSSPSKPPKEIIQVINKLSVTHILPYERLLLDIHSGRIFGEFGVIIVDISAIACILLAVSGCWIWIRHKFRRHHLSRKQ